MGVVLDSYKPLSEGSGSGKCLARLSSRFDWIVELTNLSPQQVTAMIEASEESK